MNIDDDITGHAATNRRGLLAASGSFEQIPIADTVEVFTAMSIFYMNHWRLSPLKVFAKKYFLQLKRF